VRQALVAVRAASKSDPGPAPLPKLVTDALGAVNWHRDAPPPGGAARERWEALAALVRLAEELELGSLAEFHAELLRRAAVEHTPTVDGVTLASLHSAKGLEWDAVFLVGLAEGTLPTAYAKTDDAVEEERRLLYVGITRARQWLWLSYGQARSPGGRTRRPCRFLPQLTGTAGPAGSGPGKGRPGQRRNQMVSCWVCGATLLAGADRKLGRCATCPADRDEELYQRLREWRRRTAAAAQVPAYVVFTDATLAALSERKPTTEVELTMIGGIGPRKLGQYGAAVLALITGADVDQVTSHAETQ